MAERYGLDIGLLPVRYLGLPLMTRRMTKMDCLPLIEKIKGRINSWKNKYLSYAGRLQLLTSVISSLTNFWISAFRLPSSCIKEIEQICSVFLWDGPSLNSKRAKVAWQNLCKPKQEGGLGIKAIAEANKVSCFKLIWRIVSARSSLWVNWIQRQLIRTGSFWSVKDSGTLGSWIWRKLLKYRSQAQPFVKMEVKRGLHTSFWHDNWNSMGCLHQAVGDRGFIDMGISSTASVSEVLASHRRRRHRLPVFNKIEEEIEQLRFRNVTVGDDVALWRGRDNRFKACFSTYETWNQTRTVLPSRAWYSGVWFSNATPKYSFIVWLATLNRLATGERMISWTAGVNASCVFCRDPLETRDHLFFSCSFSNHIWKTLVGGILHSSYTSDFNTLLSILTDSSVTNTTQFILRYVFQATIHTLWHERNRRRHGEIAKTASTILKALDQTVRTRLYSLQTQDSKKYQDGLSLWFGSRT